MDSFELKLGDCLEIMRGMPDNSVDSICADPPSGIFFMGAKWDSNKGGRDQWIAWMTEVATECLRVIKPGGHALIWTLPRTSHWTATAWENAGFEIRDSIAYFSSADEKMKMFIDSLSIEQRKLLEVINDKSSIAHVFGQGFPKSANIGKKIDSLLGNEREEIWVDRYHDGKERKNLGYSNHEGSVKYTPGNNGNIETKGNSEFEGYGTGLKPSHESWLLLRKPISEKSIAENVLKWGCGGINIDGCRIESNGESLKGGAADGSSLGKIHEGYQRPFMQDAEKMAEWHKRKLENIKHAEHQGRFPANIILDNSDSVKALFPETTSGKMKAGQKRNSKPMFGSKQDYINETIGDSGSAARYFKAIDPDPIAYFPKASRKDRNEGCEGFEEKPAFDNKNGNMGGNMGSRSGPRTNAHPCVKNTNLMRYLCRLITPPNGIVLDMFMGSGSTGKACMLEGFRFIGIEQDEEYFEIAKARIEHAANPGELFMNFRKLAN